MGTTPSDQASSKQYKTLSSPLPTRHSRFQLIAISAQVLKGRSSLVILPTGAGKSLCYQLPAYIFGKQRAGLMLVISPLVSLIDDQVLRLPKGLVGATLNSSMTPRQKDKVWERFSTLNVLFVAPETATSAHFLHTVAKQNCALACWPACCGMLWHS